MGVLLVLCACSQASGGPATTVQPPATETTLSAPDTSAAQTTVQTTAEPGTETTSAADETTPDGPCQGMSDAAVALWQRFFEALGEMGASELGGERWLEIDATIVLEIEEFDFEATKAQCGTSRSLVCGRLDELSPAGEVADFYLDILEGECRL